MVRFVQKYSIISSPCAEPDRDDHVPKTTLAFLLPFIHLILGSTSKNSYARHEPDYVDYLDGVNETFVAASYDILTSYLQ